VLPANDTRQLDEEAEKTLRAERPQKPNWALLPPIGNPYFIAYYGAPRPPDKEHFEAKYQNLESASYHHGYTNNWWLKRGVLPLVHVGGTGFGSQNLPDWVRYYLSIAEDGFPGIAIDELWGPDEKYPQNSLMFEACRIVKEKYPQFFIAVHQGALTPSCAEALKKGYIDLAISENYTYVYGKPDWAVSLEGIRQRMKLFRAAGLLEKTLWHIGWLEPEADEYFLKGMSPERLEAEIQLIRRWAPDVAGVCFYAWAFTRGERNKLLPLADRLAYEYFIKPAPKIEIKIIPERETGRIKVKVKAIPSVRGRGIKNYKIFLNERLVSEKDEWIWEAKKVPSGEYLITAQAITSDWYKGVRRVSVLVENGCIRKIRKEKRDYENDKILRQKGEEADALSQKSISETSREPTRALAVKDKICYLGVGKEVDVLDLSELEKKEFAFLKKIGSISLPEIPEKMAVKENFLYVADGKAGILVIDITSPLHPKVVTHYSPSGYIEDVFPVGKSLLAAGGEGGLFLLDISNPAKIKRIGFYPFPWVFSLFVRDNIAYVAAGLEGLRLIDITNPAEPKELGFYKSPDWVLKTFATDEFAYIADWNGGLRIVDIKDPKQPKEVGSYQLPWVWDVAGKEKTLYVADENIGLRLIDISNPLQPKEISAYDRPEPGDALSVMVDSNTLFLIDGWMGLRVFGISDSKNLSVRPLGLYNIGSIWNVWEKGFAQP